MLTYRVGEAYIVASWAVLHIQKRSVQVKNPHKRGSAPDRAREASDRPGSFKKGRKKVGGRKKGTPNAFSADYKRAILEAAYRVGEDANGKLGIVGYLQWVAIHHPKAFCRLLGGVMELQELEVGMPEKPLPTVEERDEEAMAYFDQRRADTAGTR
jgi:hypothetical protein